VVNYIDKVVLNVKGWLNVNGGLMERDGLMGKDVVLYSSPLVNDGMFLIGPQMLILYFLLFLKIV